MYVVIFVHAIGLYIYIYITRVKQESSTTMFRKMISRCVLPVIIAVFFVGQCEANEIRFDDEVRYEDEVITAVSRFYW